MKIWEKVADKVAGLWAGASIGGHQLQLGLSTAEYVAEHNATREAAGLGNNGIESKITESLASIELSLDDMGWQDMTHPGGLWQFSRAGLTKMVALSRLMYLMNPLIKRAVTVQELYVWGSGCNVKADDDLVDEVIHDFLDDEANQEVIGKSWDERERQQRIDGNTFFVIFENPANGRLRIRTLPIDQIEDILKNPKDAKEPWFYKRYSDGGIDPITMQPTDNDGSYLIPDINYLPDGRASEYSDPYFGGTHPVKWNMRILHVKSGGLPNFSFGMPEMFSALNWATAYKKILENFATILAAYARFALMVKNHPGKKSVAASKAKLNTTMSSSNLPDGNPPPNTAAYFLASGGMEISAIKTAHSTTGPDEAQALRSMVAAGTDTPEHFFGDSDIGNFATSTTLDRPTELKMVSRQSFWAYVITKLCRVAIESSAKAPSGKLNKAGFSYDSTPNPFGGVSRLVTVTPPANRKLSLMVTWPPIVDREIVDRVRAVVQVLTLNGSPAEGIIPDRKTAAKLLLEALGRKDFEKLADELYPDEVLQGFKDPGIDQENETKQADAKVELAKNPPISSGQKVPASTNP